jgi:predicted acetyltransferase
MRLPPRRAGEQDGRVTEPYPIRPISEDEFDDFSRVDQHAFNSGPMPAEQRARSIGILEFDRTLAAFDGDQITGTAGAYSFQFGVPGAVIPAAGVTRVSVLPTHRRRGILRSMMRQQLSDIAERGEAFAALWASEAIIYARYGYGRATSHATWTVGRGEYQLAPQAPRDPALRLRLVEPEDARAELAKVFDGVLHARPGLFARDDKWWERQLADPEAERGGRAPWRTMLAEDDSGPRGFARYQGQGDWDEDTFLANGTITVGELMATDPAAEAAMWENLLSRDLVTKVVAHLRPADDPLQFQLLDGRRLRQQVSDGLWVRLTNLPLALNSRAYSVPVDIVIEVRDDLLPANAGRWHLISPGPLDGAAAGASRCTPAAPTDKPDISLDVRELGAAYLGGTSLGSLAAAGLVTEHRPGAVAALSAAMQWHPSPWCPAIF